MRATTTLPEAETQLKSTTWLCFLATNLRISSRRNVVLIAWLLLALASCFIAYVARMHRIDHDLFHEMALYRESLVADQFPVSDVFAYTPTVNPAVHHEWGTGAVLYFVTIGTGLGAFGLAFLRLLLIAALGLFLYRIARMRGAHPIVYAISCIIVFPFLWVGFATIRAQLFTLVFIAAQLWMQELDTRGRRAWTLAWLLMLIAWLNMHAGFVVGLGMIAFHSIESWVAALFRGGLRFAFQRTWHLIAIAPLAALATRINPYGWDYIPYLIRAIRMPRPMVLEWQPIWMNYAPVLTVGCFGIAVLTFAYCLRNLRSLHRMRGALSLGICCYMALRHIRHGSIFAVVWIAYVPAWLSRTNLGRALIALCERTDRYWIRGSQIAVTLTLSWSVYHHVWMPSLPPRPQYSKSCYPSEAIEYLRDNQFSGNLITPFQYGSYVSWQLYPKVKVSLDSRYEVAYQEHVVDEHVAFTKVQGDNWWNLLDRYPSDLALIEVHSPVVEHLAKLSASSLPSNATRLTNQSWEIVYRDDSYIILASELWAEKLPHIDRRNQPLADRVGEVFSMRSSHWARAVQ
jgi:hypothetical protein